MHEATVGGPPRRRRVGTHRRWPGAHLPDGCTDLIWTGEDLIVADPDTTAHLDAVGTERLVAVRFPPGVGPSVFRTPRPSCAIGGATGGDLGRRRRATAQQATSWDCAPGGNARAGCGAVRGERADRDDDGGDLAPRRTLRRRCCRRRRVELAAVASPFARRLRLRAQAAGPDPAVRQALGLAE